MDRIKVCVEEATAPAAAAAEATAAAATASSGPGSRPGSPPLPPAAPTDSGNAPRRKKGRGSAGGGAAGTGGSEAPQCNWALAHAACRVCRVVGRTFQVAIRCVRACVWGGKNGQKGLMGRVLTAIVRFGGFRSAAHFLSAAGSVGLPCARPVVIDR